MWHVGPIVTRLTMHRSSAAVAVLLCCCAALAFSLKREERPPISVKQVPPQVLPGVQPDGSIRLPNQWSLRPAGKQMTLGDFPVNLALHPEGKFLAALHAG